MSSSLTLDVRDRQLADAEQLHTSLYGQAVKHPPGLSASTVGDPDFDGRLAPSNSVIP
jgi:hypothetical protein